MIKDTIKVSFRKLRYIHHISDIQIRNLKRHKEYEEVFDRLYEEVKKYPYNSVAYIGGDIAHSKTQMSPELVDQLSRLFKNLADICPTIIIAGNHDCNLNNRSRMDVLSPIVNNLNHKNLHYLKNTGVYKCADVQFAVWDVWDNQKDYPLAKDIEGDTKVVLFHGTVDQSRTDLGFRLPSKVKISKFRGYDLALLGDIHKRQHLNRKKTISYCGSLVQQNHGEGLDHGYLLWDVPSRKSTYIPIQNDYGYYTLDVDNGIVPDVNDMPQKARLRIRVSDTDAVQLKKALAIIHKRYGIKEIVVNRTDRLTERVRDGKQINVGDITSPGYQYELIEDYLKRNHIVDDDTLLKIKDINDNLNTLIPSEEISRNVFWKLKRFEFDNMFSYGEDNVVDFSRLNGIIGMFAPNASGKSAMLDALSFCLFDTCSRTFKADRILNNKKGSFSCKVNFEIEGLDYFIERHAKKLKRGHVKVDVEFWLVDESGDKISLNGDQRRSTDANIRKVIGTYEDFVMTSLSLQDNSTVFIDKGQKERKELLAQFMGMGIFDELYQLASEDIKDVLSVLKNFKKQDYGKDLADIEKEMISYKEHHKNLKNDNKKLIDQKRDLDEQVILLTTKIKPIDSSILNINKLVEVKDTLKESLGDIDLRLGTIKSAKNENGVKVIELEERIEHYTKHNINKQYLELQEYESDRSETKIEIDKLKIDVQHKIDKINKLGNLEYDPECTYCMNNIFVKDAIHTKNELEKDKKLASKYVERIDNLDDILKEIDSIRTDKINFDRTLEALKNTNIQQNKLDSENILIKSNKENILQKISIVDNKISEYYEKESDIKYNEDIEAEVDNVQNDLDNVNYQIDVLVQKMQTIYSEIQVFKSKKKSILDDIDKVETFEQKYNAYEYYLDAIKRDGVPYELIEKALPTIEGEVNDILSQMVDFGIVIEMDGKNINTYLAYDADNVWPLELSSGMEKFISSLSIRTALINVCNLPRSNFLAIDEGWGKMDSDNLNSVYMLFQYLKTQFQFALIVSHIEGMRDAVDSLLEITQENGYSKIDLPSKFN